MLNEWPEQWLVANIAIRGGAGIAESAFEVKTIHRGREICSTFNGSDAGIAVARTTML